MDARTWIVLIVGCLMLITGGYSIAATRRAQRSAATEYRRSDVIARWAPFLISFIESEEWIWLRRVGGVATFVAGLLLLIAYFGLVK
jgi:hypothetical protein